jgi:hypothetical protein
MTAALEVLVVDYGLAVRESAHAVAMAVLGMPFHDVKLTPGEAIAGGVRGGRAECESRPRAYAVSLIVGIVSELRGDGFG